MKSTRKPRKPMPAEAIARLADQGSDVSRFFTNTGRMMRPGPIQRVNVDLASGMLEELDRAAKELNISRQAVIKTLIRQALDQAGWPTSRFETWVTTVQFTVAPPQHHLYFFPEPHGQAEFRPRLGAICRGAIALLPRRTASPFYGGAVLLATDHTGSACRSIVRGWCPGRRPASAPCPPKFPRCHSRCATGRPESPQGAWRCR